MTVHQLRERLKDCNPDDIVILASDEEGNAFHGVYQTSRESMVSTGRTFEHNDTQHVNSIVLWPG